MSNAQGESGIEGTVTLSPSHPGPIRKDMPSSRPLADMEFAVMKDGRQIATFKTDAEGKFRMSLGAGHYTVARKETAKSIGSFGPFDVDVVAGKFAHVDWTCDSGMR